MKLISPIICYSLAASLVFLLGSCTPVEEEPAPVKEPVPKKIPKAVFVNPHPAGTYAHFKAEPSYPKTYNTWKNKSLFESTTKYQTRIEISLSKQRAVMYKGDEPIYDYPVSTGKTKFPTPQGSYTIIEMIEADKRSNIYGKIYNESGSVVKSSADSRKDKVPAGGRFEGALMRNWMRLTWTGIGMHQGRVPRYPASHGCIRTPSGVVSSVFHKVRIGTPVEIKK